MTTKDLKGVDLVIRVPYCGAQHLTKWMVKLGYNSGVYGWNWDAFVTQATSGRSVIICTGYRNLYGERTPELDDIVEQYDEEIKLTPHDKKMDVLRRFADEVVLKWQY